MSHSPNFLSLDALGANGRPMKVLRLETLGTATPDAVSVAGCHLILILTEGSGRARHVEALDIGAGDIHFIPAGAQLQLLQAGDMAGWLIGFDPVALALFGAMGGHAHSDASAITQLLPAQSLFVRGALRLNPAPARWQRLLQIVTDLYTEQQRSDWGSEQAAEVLLRLLMIELQREMHDNAPQAPLAASPVVRAALAHLEAHCLEPLSINDIARAVKRSASWISHAVRKETGLTIGDWLREHRMVEARRRLVETSASVEAIAGAVGYGDVTHFIRTFRKSHGMTPRAWRVKRRSS